VKGKAHLTGGRAARQTPNRDALDRDLSRRLLDRHRRRVLGRRAESERELRTSLNPPRLLAAALPVVDARRRGVAEPMVAEKERGSSRTASMYKQSPAPAWQGRAGRGERVGGGRVTGGTQGRGGATAPTTTTGKNPETPRVERG